MIKRRQSKPLFIGGVQVGGDAPISVQSMTKTDTRDVKSTVEQIHRLQDVGCEIIRLAEEEGKRLTSMGALPEASQYFGRAIEMNPQSAAAHNELGRIYFMGGFLDLAKKRFEKAISLIPDFEQAHFNLAQVYYHEK